MNRILLTGGAGCGKSSYGESLAISLSEPRYYIACMEPFNAASRQSIARNRQQRQAGGFINIEQYRDIAGLILPQRGTVLLECICNLTANEMFGAEDIDVLAVERILRGIHHLAAQCTHLIVVTNDIGSGGSIYDQETERYIKAVGTINRRLAADFE
ncbi:MAG: bifunctional adenosylcobinamide kinase/adenosylcobinamide-phosphate guanylyltransferase, partial [Clostridiales bacterium]